MTQPPFALVRASINGGAIQTGGITATGGQTCQLSADPAGLSGATQYLWEILDYPPSFALPSGWSADAQTPPIYYYAAQTPPVFTLDANTARWGKYMFRLTLNGGGPALTGRETAAQRTAILALVDTSCAAKVLSPNGQHDSAFGETTQFGGRLGWMGDVKKIWRIVESLLGGGAGGAVLANGSVAFTGDESMGGHKLTNLATPSATTDAVTKAYVDAHSGGGAGRGFPFTYAGSGTIADADPGSGIFRGNNATLASSTQLFIDDVAANGATGMAAWIASFDDQVGAVKGVLRVQSASDPTKFIEWPVSAITTASGYSKVTLGTAWGPGGITTTASDTLLSFDAAGVSSNLNNQDLKNAKGYGYNGEVATTGATPAVDFTTGDLQLTTLNASATPTFTAPASVRWVQWCVIQDSTPRTITFPGSVVGTPPQPSTVSGSRTFYGFFYDGTSYHYAAADLSVYALVNGTRAFTGGVTVTQAAVAAGTPTALKITGGAHTANVASVEQVDVDLALNRTVQFATGALTTQRASVVRAPTYGFVGASTITDAATLAITGAPVAGTNATITNAYALWVQAGNVRIGALGVGLVHASSTGLLSSSLAVDADVSATAAIAGSKIAPAFGSQVVSSTSAFSFGSSPASVGAYRMGNNDFVVGKTTLAADVTLIGVSSGDTVGVGASTVPIVVTGGTSVSLRVGASNILQAFAASVRLLTNNLNFDSSQVAPVISQAADTSASVTCDTRTDTSQDGSGTTAVTAGAWDRRAGDATGASGTRNGGHLYDRPGHGGTANGNWGWFVQSADAVNWQSMQGGVYMKSADAAPSADPTGGLFHWCDSGAPMWRYATNQRFKLGAAAATASAGAGALPATPQEFLTIELNGNVRKIPCYLT